MPPSVRSGSLACAAAFCVLALPSRGQENEPAGAASARAASPSAAPEQALGAAARSASATLASEPAEAPEEITVTGQRALSSMRFEIGKATERFWDLLGTVLDDRDYAVTCNREVPLGTHIAERVCRTEYQREEIRKAADAHMRGGLYDPYAGSARKNREFTARMIAAVNTNPDLLAAVEELERLKTAYEAEQESLANARPTRAERRAKD